MDYWMNDFYIVIYILYKYEIFKINLSRYDF